MMPADSSNDHEACKVVGASRPDYGAFVVWGRDCYFKGVTCEQHLNNSGETVSYVKHGSQWIKKF